MKTYIHKITGKASRHDIIAFQTQCLTYMHLKNFLLTEYNNISDVVATLESKIKATEEEVDAAEKVIEERRKNE